MSDFVHADQVILDIDINSKEEALVFLSNKAQELGITDDAHAVKAAYDHREEEGSTGMMDCFAVPHAKSSAIKRAAVIVLRFKNALSDWETFDNTDVKIAVSLLVPDAEAGDTHIRLLAEVAKMIMDEEFRQSLNEAKEPSVVADLINSRL